MSTRIIVEGYFGANMPKPKRWTKDRAYRKPKSYNYTDNNSDISAQASMAVRVLQLRSQMSVLNNDWTSKQAGDAIKMAAAEHGIEVDPQWLIDPKSTIMRWEAR